MTHLKLLGSLLMLCLFSVSTELIAQIPANETVLQSFAPSELANMDSSEIEWLNFMATESFVVSQMTEKSGNLQDLTQRDPQALTMGINPFRAGISPSDENQYFRIGNTGKVVIFYSADRVQTLWERKQINLK